MNTNIWLGFSGSYLLHLATLPLASWAGDFDSDGALLPLAPQCHAIGLQGAEGDLQLWLREATYPAVLGGNLRRVQYVRKARGALEVSTCESKVKKVLKGELFPPRFHDSQAQLCAMDFVFPPNRNCIWCRPGLTWLLTDALAFLLPPDFLIMVSLWGFSVNGARTLLSFIWFRSENKYLNFWTIQRTWL